MKEQSELLQSKVRWHPSECIILRADDANQKGLLENSIFKNGIQISQGPIK